MAVTTTYAVTADGNMAYVINGQSNPSLSLIRGNDYVFQINAMGHPFWIQTTGGGYSSSAVYENGVTGNGVQIGTVTLHVASDAPDVLYYQCQNHTMMGGQFSVSDPISSQQFLEVDPFSPTIEDLVDKVFYGIKQNRLTGKASIDTILGDEPIRIPSAWSTRADDYLNWMWSYNSFRYYYDEETGHLLMEVL